MRSQCSPKDHLLDLDGVEIAVRCWGPEDGIPVLALHGWLDNAASFDRLAPLLDGCFVVAPDLAGHGRSDHRRDDSGYYLWEHAEDMLAVVDSLGLGHFHVLAHGMGTGIASLLAALTSSIASMVFLDGMGAPFTVAEDDRVAHLARAYRLKRMVRAAVCKVLPSLAGASSMTWIPRSRNGATGSMAICPPRPHGCWPSATCCRWARAIAGATTRAWCCPNPCP